MSVAIPPAKNYGKPVVSLPTWYDRVPTEGKRFIPLSIDWGADASTQGAISINFYGMAANTISQIVALAVDNSKCGADVTFVFPDTGMTYSVAAYEPSAVFPVFTGAQSFFMVAPDALADDLTNLSVHNSLPPPSALNRTTFQEAAASGEIDATIAQDIVLIAGSGTLEYLAVLFATGGSSTSFSFNLLIHDGTNKTFFNTAVQFPSTSAFNRNLLDVQNCSIRFSNGLHLKTAAGGGFPSGGLLSANALYRTP